MTAEHTPEEQLPEVFDERPQRRREWSGRLRSVVLPLLAVAAIVGVVWYIQAGRSGGSAKPAAGLGVISLDPARNHSGKPPAPLAGRAAPDFRLATLSGGTLDGGTIRLSDLQGKLVLINFWATWCLPCREEMPRIVRAYAQYRDKGFEVLSVDAQEDPGTVQKWIDEFGMQFPVAMDTTGNVGRTYRAGTQFPTSVWVDPNGIITEYKYGPMTQDYLDQHLAPLANQR